MLRNALLVAFLVSTASLISAAQPPAPQSPSTPASSPVEVVLADGTPVKLRLGNTASSGARVGENLELEVAEDVRISNVVVVAKGNTASAEVTGLHAGVGNVGRIDVNLRSITLSDGRAIPVRSTKERPTGQDQSMIVSSATQDASIAPGTTVIAFINGDQPLDLTRLRAAGGPSQSLKITSTPPNADVSVDGRLTGTTPYVFHLSAGDHSVVVRMVGFKVWQRTIRVGGESVSLDASLLKEDGSEAAPSSKPSEASLGDLARAARARKAQQGSPDTSGQTPASNQAGPRDPMEAPAPKQ